MVFSLPGTTPPAVSVPSIGSKAVQRNRATISALRSSMFQYPLSGRRLCSAQALRDYFVGDFLFQYPLSGRRLCSAIAEWMMRIGGFF